MWPFGKKKEKTEHKPETKPEMPQDAQVQEFAQKFLPEEFTLLAVTSFGGFSYNRVEGKSLALVGVGLTAWLKDGEEEVHHEPAHLVTLADDNLMSYLRTRLPSNFILKAKVRASKEGNHFQLIGMPEPGFDPDLKAILDEQKKPVTIESEEFGTFTLMRAAGWFDAEAEWNGESTRLVFNQDEAQEGCLATAHALFADQEGWDTKVREYTADQLLAQANEWAAESGEEEELSRDEFMDQLIPDSIQTFADGSFQFCYGEGGVFWGHSIQVSGNLTAGVTAAEDTDLTAI